ncbi:hypothetical protein STAS_35493 [Striga asiatica]|uniref:Uncharacterized protein n=1 Tax=Striga asiatica TaxID=4170 RepID=A0A5A7RKE4_STRAF|nr:hypothetical protein STAS_35493 [Striga asiatica]
MSQSGQQDQTSRAGNNRGAASSAGKTNGMSAMPEFVALFQNLEFVKGFSTRMAQTIPRVSMPIRWQRWLVAAIPARPIFSSSNRSELAQLPSSSLPSSSPHPRDLLRPSASFTINRPGPPARLSSSRTALTWQNLTALVRLSTSIWSFTDLDFLKGARLLLLGLNMEFKKPAILPPGEPGFLALDTVLVNRLSRLGVAGSARIAFAGPSFGFLAEEGSVSDEEENMLESVDEPEWDDVVVWLFSILMARLRLSISCSTRAGRAWGPEKDSSGPSIER